jgi:PAS domain S-box-containing protein
MFKNTVSSILFLSVLANFVFAKELEKVSLQLQWLDQFQFAGYYMAKEKGFYKEAGLDVDIKKYCFSTSTTDEVISGRANFAVGRSSLLIDKSNNNDIIMLSPIFQSSPIIFLSTKDSNITSIKDFKNKKIMVTSDSILTASLYALLDKFNLKSSDIILQKHTFNVDDLISHKTDIMISYTSNEPFLMQQKHEACNIIDPKDYGLDFYADILFTNKNEIKNHKNRVQKFVQASLRGWEYAFENIDESVRLILDKYNSQNKSKEALTFEANELKKLAYYKTEQLGKISLDKIQNIYDTYDKMGLIKNRFDVKDIVFSKSLKDELVLSQKEKDFLKAKSDFSVCLRENWLPYEGLNESSPVGISVELLNLITSKLPINFNFNFSKTQEELREKLENSECDIKPIMWQKSQNIVKNSTPYETTRNYFKDDIVLVTNIETPFVNDINTIDKILLSVKGFESINRFIKLKFPNIKILQVDSIDHALEHVANSEAFGVIGLSLPLSYKISKEYPSRLKIMNSFGKVEFSMGISKENSELKSILNKALRNIKELEKKKILDKWLAVTIEKKPDHRLLIISIAFFAVVFMFVFAFMLKLNRLKNELSEQKEAFENLYQKSSDGILLLQNNEIFDCNEAALKMFGYEHKDELIKSNPKDINPQIQANGANSCALAKEFIAECHKLGTKSFEWQLKRKDGEIFWADMALTKIVNKESSIIHALLRDISKRKEMELYMKELNANLNKQIELEVKKSREKDQKILAQSRLAQMGEMISMIAHQWRQPLTAIGSIALSLRLVLDLGKYDFKGEKEEEFKNRLLDDIDTINSHVQTLSSTIDDFRNFYKTDKKSNKISVNEPVLKALRIIKGSFDSNNIKTKIDLNSTKEMMIFDGELMQVFLNIFKNAQDNFIDTNTQNRVVKISSYDTDTGIEVLISDSGGGVKEEVKDKIFDPYFSTKTEKNGTGLGLYMSKIIIEDHHNGVLNLYNKNGWANFNIALKY